MRAIVAACIGNFLEWYEFVLYGYFAAVFAALFFPQEDSASASSSGRSAECCSAWWVTGSGEKPPSRPSSS
jgi:hypothetical protein